nr:unnamed protein product [Digitaria exilis]
MNALLPLVLLCASSSSLLLLLLAPTTNADNLTFYLSSYCPTAMNYTRGSAFEANLDALLSSLPAAAAASSGFATNTTGAAAPDQAFGLAQCRGDVSAPDCRACLAASAQQMATTKCPGQKSAVLAYEGCLLRYSNASFVGELDASNPLFMCDLYNATDLPRFAASRDALMRGLAGEAAGSPRRFAAGSANLTLDQKIYGVAQCTRDLGVEECQACLDNAVSKIQVYRNCSGRRGGRLFNWSCSIRFELAPFYNATAADPVMSTKAGGESSGTGRSTSTTLIVSIPVAIALLLLLLLFAVYICKKNTKPHRLMQIIASDGLGDEEDMRSSEPLQYNLSTLRAATNNFSEENKLGKGGFGPVYKGTIQNGNEIAVKRLSTISQQGIAEMKNEIVLVAKLQHKNLVRLLGFCIEEEEKLLVYEFLSNKSLNKFLFEPAKEQKLSWGQRYKIIKGISRGLLYLHEDSRLKIIHRDLKPGNILLDADMNPKISDFGLAKLFKVEESGVWRHWSLGSVPQVLDDYLADETDKQDMLRCIHIGLLCVQDDPQVRPRMASILHMLDNRIITMSAPTKPAFVIPGPGELPMAATPEPSINEASISHLEPR